ncbi:hypothetical protein DPEC_G00277050 [Dallia pectoralis]|uniref:Uncharacterized protein n=1 Tax=Dallia pectoralis TaxID=75939 RepID=A0ACC2FM11_DALPE|nr:hypothetical protein DPEC_G00277050 [Dallia pectoralis]
MELHCPLRGTGNKLFPDSQHHGKKRVNVEIETSHHGNRIPGSGCCRSSRAMGVTELRLSFPLFTQYPDLARSHLSQTFGPDFNGAPLCLWDTSECLGRTEGRAVRVQNVQNRCRPRNSPRTDTVTRQPSGGGEGRRETEAAEDTRKREIIMLPCNN